MWDKHLFEHGGVIVVNVGAFAIFLVGFFFLLGKWVEGLALGAQLETIIDQGINGEMLEILGTSAASTIRQHISNITLPDMGAEDRAVDRQNRDIRTSALLVTIPSGIGAMVLGSLVIFFTTTKPMRARRLLQSLSMTAMMIFAVLVVEVSFAMLVSRNYKTTPTKWVVAQVFDALLAKKS